MAKTMTIALLGQPNSGKSAFYNALTDSHQHVGNWPGKTVERSIGTFRHGGRAYTVVDLPGTYSLAANSEEEIVTRDYIASGEADLVCPSCQTPSAKARNGWSDSMKPCSRSW